MMNSVSVDEEEQLANGSLRKLLTGPVFSKPIFGEGQAFYNSQPVVLRSQLSQNISPVKSLE